MKIQNAYAVNSCAEKAFTAAGEWGDWRHYTGASFLEST